MTVLRLVLDHIFYRKRHKDINNKYFLNILYTLTHYVPLSSDKLEVLIFLEIRLVKSVEAVASVVPCVATGHKLQDFLHWLIRLELVCWQIDGSRLTEAPQLGNSSMHLLDLTLKKNPTNFEIHLNQDSNDHQTDKKTKFNAIKSNTNNNIMKNHIFNEARSWCFTFFVRFSDLVKT